MEEIFISEEFEIDEVINKINELTSFFCQLYYLNEEERESLVTPIRRAILLGLNQYMNEDSHENFVFYVGPFVKMAVAEFRTATDF